MAVDVLERAAAEVHRGKYGSAFDVLSRRPSDIADDSAGAALLSEVLHRLGRLEEAVDAATSLLETASLPPSLRARCYMVLGSVAAQTAGKEFAPLLRTAVRVAEDSGDIEQICRAQQRLFSILSDRSELHAAAALLPDLRKNVTRCGQPQITAYLYACFARLDAGRGSWSRALRHFELSLELLRDDPNIFLEAMFKSDASVVAHQASEFELAVQFATDALRCAKQSGVIQAEVTALANVAWAQTALGDLDKAEAAIHDGLKCAGHFHYLRAALLDTKAHLRMYRGDCKGCEEILNEIEERFVREPDIRYSALNAEVLLTRARLLCWQRSWAAARSVADRGLGIGLARGDRYSELSFRALLAESLIELGDFSEASAAISTLTRRADGSSLVLLADTQRARAKAAGLAHPAKAARIFERALRLARPVGHVRGVQEAVTDYANWLSVQRGHSAVIECQALPASCRRSVPQTQCLRIDAATQPTGQRVDEERIAALFDVSTNAPLAAYEAFYLFYDSGCVEALALVTRQQFRRTEIRAYAGWGYRDARAAIVDAKERTVIRFGTFGEQRYELIVQPKPDLESRCMAVAIEKLVKAALSLERLRKEEKERAALWPLDEVSSDMQSVFAAAGMMEILATAKRIAPTTLSVLLTGETGTGKEVLARAIHRSSPRAARPFVPFNCTAVPRDMVESQLFGYRRGAFTGAQEAFSGVIRAAAGGTLFLDEIGDLSLEVQPKLLRFLETGEIQPLGDAQPMPVDVRVIAATNADLDKMVAEGRFREDLFYRLNVIRFRLPPLRERREEIPPLVHHFIGRFTDEFHKGHIRLAEETMEYLLLYRWPGNVRQLENELRRVIALAEKDAVLTPAHLTSEIRESRRTVPASESVPTANETLVRVDQPLAAVLESVERTMVHRALDVTKGNVTEAAKILGVSRKGLFLMRRRLGFMGNQAASEAGA